MYAQELAATARAMMARGKGLLAADESNGTCNKRFEQVGIPTTEEMRRAYRDMLLTTPGINECLSGVILFDETIRQTTKSGVPFANHLMQIGIIPGIKLDKGAKPLAGHPNETVTEGLDGLRDRIAEYYQMGARFAKWRAVYTIDGDRLPSRSCIETNAHALARYAALCQEGGLVPIVEPEVLINGNHTLERSYDVHRDVLKVVFDQLFVQDVDFDKMILKPSMVVSGLECPQQASVEDVARATVKCLKECVPSAVPGCAFLSGGQSAERATAHLNAMNAIFKDELPWTLTFSYARALQQPAMEAWKGNDANVSSAQQLFHIRAKLNSAASQGQYTPEMETEMKAVTV
ncbi:fructose-bisphosphate aldolase class I [Oculatella sp. LEGE 06141]|uniref:class I fructose-bisphosphate aldolase n=1 Tax=Oculatella sp. LEGE 06141 TaxID=1828648 RepID=UPI00187E92BB|nr:class I fructose-bisphosphate aldolase [Oculatella sp. LEGE 06141]MBE9177939.1 fructose-bisphosphate aldolase class I [Oculatella sp. LEGE 06141]